MKREDGMQQWEVGRAVPRSEGTTKTITVLIDGKAVEVPRGSSALFALRAAGLDVPTGCYDPRLKPTGACRLCLVKVSGSTRPVSSCALTVHEGMEIEVASPELDEARKGEIAMLARSYPHEYAETLPEKVFHVWLRRYGLVGREIRGERVEERTGRVSAILEEPERPQKMAPGSGKASLALPEVLVSPDQDSLPLDLSNPYFRFDPAACIKCYKCVQICSELQGANVWQIMDRAQGSRVIPDSMGALIDSSCKSCGACVDACPTAALVDKTRLEEGLAEKWTRTTCPYCGVGCELSVGTRHDKIVQVLPVLEAPVSKGHVCVKGRYAHQYVHAKDRILTPLIRRNGILEPTSWEEALAFAAGELKRILNDHGPSGIGVLGSARAPNEDNYMAQKFARVILGTNNVDCCARVCHGPTAAAMKATLGTGAATNSYNDVEKARTILVIGCNPTENHPIVGERIRQAVLGGANLVVIDPRRIDLARMADVHVQLKPGTNVALLNAMAHVALCEGLADEPFLAGRVAEVKEFREFVREWTPERAGLICGVEPGLIREAARLYASEGPSMAFHGLGMTEHMQGTEGVMCLVNLALLTGNIGKEGAGINPLRGQNNVQGSAHMGCEPSNLTGYVPIPENKARFEEVWNASVPEAKGLTLMQMMDEAAKGRLKALWAIGYDVYFTNASANTTRKSFEAMELVIVQDLFLNETAKEFAHVFFPACSSFERGGTFMNAERRVQRVRKAIEPLGESKPDWEIVQMLAGVLLSRSSVRAHRSTPRVPLADGFSFTTEEEIWDEIRLLWKPGAGMSYARLEEGGLQWPCTSEDHPGTTILHREAFPLGPRATLRRIEYTPTPEVTSDLFPFLMNTGRTLYQFNAGTMTGRTLNNRLRSGDTLDMNPKDAEALSLKDGDRVRVVSAYGCAELPLRLDSGIRRGELFATFHSTEVFLNLVTSEVRDGIVGTPEYKVTAVRVEAAAQMEP